MSGKYEQIYYGDYRDVTNGITLRCCDCGLVHKVEYDVLNGRVLRRMFERPRKTASSRAAMKRAKEGIFRKKKKKESKKCQ